MSRFVLICFTTAWTISRPIFGTPIRGVSKSLIRMYTAESLAARISRGRDLDEIRAISELRPITSNSITNPEFDAATVQRDAEQTRIIVHYHYAGLVKAFLAHKRQHGSAIEKALYTQDNWTWERQVARLGEFWFATNCFLVSFFGIRTVRLRVDCPMSLRL